MPVRRVILLVDSRHDAAAIRFSDGTGSRYGSLRRWIPGAVDPVVAIEFVLLGSFIAFVFRPKQPFDSAP